MDTTTVILAALFGIFIILGIWQAIFTRNKPPEERKRWHPRFVVFNSIYFGLVAIGALILSGQYLFAGIMLLFLVAITYLKLTKERICPNCGELVPPHNLINAAKACPKCGERIPGT